MLNKLSVVIGFWVLVSTQLMASTGQQVTTQTTSDLPIINGDTVANKQPWMVALIRYPIGSNTLVSERQFCGGALIAAEWVLTAAHCFGSLSATNFRVVIGELDLDASGVALLEVSEIILHPQWKSGSYSDDIAVLRLAQPSAAETLSWFTQITNSALDGTVAKVQGWGRTYVEQADSNCALEFQAGFENQSDYQCILETYEEPEPATPVLRSTTIRILSNSACNSAFREFLTANDYAEEDFFDDGDTLSPVICAQGEDKTSSACFGDSGGPLTIAENGTDHLVGITSFGISEPSCNPQPGVEVFTKVAYYNNFILEAMQRHKAYSFGEFCPPSISPDVSYGSPVAGSAKVTISWAAITNPIKYVLRYQTFPDPSLYSGSVDLAASPASLTIDLQSGLEFYLSMQGYNQHCNGPLSTPVHVRVP